MCVFGVLNHLKFYLRKEMGVKRGSFSKLVLTPNEICMCGVARLISNIHDLSSCEVIFKNIFLKI